MCWPLSSRRPSTSTLRARPPRVRAASKSVTARPAAASSAAAAQPAQPPPITATVDGVELAGWAAAWMEERLPGRTSAPHVGLPRQPQLADRRERNFLVQHMEVVALD